jgi:hypothetical protein
MSMVMTTQAQGMDGGITMEIILKMILILVTLTVT